MNGSVSWKSSDMGENDEERTDDHECRYGFYCERDPLGLPKAYQDDEEHHYDSAVNESSIEIDYGDIAEDEVSD